MIGILLSRSHGIMPPPRRFAGRSPRALRARAARQTFLPAAKTEFTERTIYNFFTNTFTERFSQLN
jgi:hypothetical protein